MFLINNKGEVKKRTSRKESAERRQAVYNTILANQDKLFTAKQLATAAGYDMTKGVDSKEYKSGFAFIDNMQRGGYIGHDIPTRTTGNSWYVSGKEKVTNENLLRETESTEDKIGVRKKPGRINIKREIHIEDKGEAQKVEVKFKKKSVENTTKKFDIVLGIALSGAEDPNNAAVEFEGKTLDEIVDAIRALGTIL